MIGFDELVTGGSINVHMVFEKTEFHSKSRFNYMKLQILYFLESPQCLRSTTYKLYNLWQQFMDKHWPPQ